jgi:CheY-like chemotaxis protein
VVHADTLKTRQILLIEPDQHTCALYSQSLQLDGYDLLEASDGRDALVKALTQSPTLVMTDTRLPMVDLYALCEVLRRDETTRTVPILVVTTDTRPADVERARAAGADAVLVKPTPPDAALNEVRARPTEASR